jgi:hypothetical protein
MLELHLTTSLAAQLFSRLFSKREMRILMVRGQHSQSGGWRAAVRLQVHETAL